MFRVLIPLLLITIQFFLYRKARRWVLQRFPDSSWLRHTITVLFALFGGALVYVAVQRPRPLEYPEWFLYVGVYPFFIWHGATLFIGLVTFVMFLVRLPFKIMIWLSKKLPATRSRVEDLQAKPAFAHFDASRRTFLRQSMYGLTAVSFAGSTYGLLYGRARPDFTEVALPIRRLPPQLEGFTIGLISDVHSSAYMTKENMDEYVRHTNSLNADMVLVTGDFVNSLNDEVYPFAEAFSNLHAPHGVYGVMGNHDFFARNPELIAKEVDGCGIKLLRNDKVVIEKNGAGFYLMGIDDTGNRQRAEERLTATMTNATMPIPRILMCHRPYFLQEAADKDIDLVLSGHTHGGQIVIAQFAELAITPAALASRYVWGSYSIGNTQMYVSRGIGTVGLPIRINCPPEITKIKLVAA